MPLTEKENFMRVMRGEVPEWVPRFTFFAPDAFQTTPWACGAIMSSAVPGTVINRGKGRVDVFGVEYVATEETGWQMLPVPGKFVLEDIRHWRNTVRLPDLSGVDWERLCKKDMEKLNADPRETALTYGVGGGFFMPLVNLMGFTNGLVALYEEPEAVKEMLDYICTWYLKIIDETFDRYPFDVYTVGDDDATALNPFISLDCYRDVFKPFMEKICRKARDRGIPVMMHDCGRCEDHIDDWLDFGVSAWNPAQTMNDLAGIKKRYGNRLVIVGGWDSSGPMSWPGVTEERLREEVRSCIDRFGPGGGYVFLGGAGIGSPADGTLNTRRRWVTEEYEAYRSTPYRR